VHELRLTVVDGEGAAIPGAAIHFHALASTEPHWYEARTDTSGVARLLSPSLPLRAWVSHKDHAALLLEELRAAGEIALEHPLPKVELRLPAAALPLKRTFYVRCLPEGNRSEGPADSSTRPGLRFDTPDWRHFDAKAGIARLHLPTVGRHELVFYRYMFDEKSRLELPPTFVEVAPTAELQVFELAIDPSSR
jgi:hypothetical protein